MTASPPAQAAGGDGVGTPHRFETRSLWAGLQASPQDRVANRSMSRQRGVASTSNTILLLPLPNLNNHPEVSWDPQTPLIRPVLCRVSRARRLTLQTPTSAHFVLLEALRVVVPSPFPCN